jgi:hypothetical protein
MKRTSLTATAALIAATAVRCSSGTTASTPQPSTNAPTPTPSTSTSMSTGHLPFGLSDPAAFTTDMAMPTTSTGPTLAPELPQCVNHSGDGDTCWGEWLKEPGTVTFTPVAKGALGAGPWPTTPIVTMGGAEGVNDSIQGVGVDTAQNVYAVSHTSLYIRRAGAAKFERYDQNTNGLQNWPFLSVAGAGPGVAWVGHEGLTPDSEFNDPPTDPPEVRHSGDIEMIELTPTGITATYHDTHNSNSPSGVWDHTRSVNNLVIPRRGPAAGEVYLSTEHAVLRYQGEKYTDHRHLQVFDGRSTHYGAAKALTVTDDGTLWYGSDYMLGALAWTPRLYEWYFDNPWILPTNAYGTEMEQDWNEGIGVDSKGGVWAAARTHGLTNLSITGKHSALETLDMPNTNANDLIVDTNDTVWVATDGGLYRYDPVAKTWKQFNEAGDGIMHVYLDDTVVPRAIYAGNNGGIFVYRGP